MVIDELESAKPKNEHEIGRLQLLIDEAFSLIPSKEATGSNWIIENPISEIQKMRDTKANEDGSSGHDRCQTCVVCTGFTFYYLAEGMKVQCIID
jgi:hypothetical protein